MKQKGDLSGRVGCWVGTGGFDSSESEEMLIIVGFGSILEFGWLVY